VAGIEAGRDLDETADIRITYRFGPPPEDIGAGVGFVTAEQNSKLKALT
jgi:hypothetical protein